MLKSHLKNYFSELKINVALYFFNKRNTQKPHLKNHFYELKINVVLYFLREKKHAEKSHFKWKNKWHINFASFIFI